jgi:hypothetical protein
MTDNLRIPRRLEGEQAVNLNPNWEKPQDGGANNLEQVSLDAVINMLVKRGICTEAELLAEENRLHALDETAEETTAPAYFTPVQTYSERHRHRHRDSNRLRQWAAKRQWSRKLGTLLFGWKWHRKKSDQEI